LGFRELKKFEEDWKRLSSHLASRIEMLQTQVANKPASVELQELVSSYKEWAFSDFLGVWFQFVDIFPSYRALERVVNELGPFAK
jgi:hypothetical protein